MPEHKTAGYQVPFRLRLGDAAGKRGNAPKNSGRKQWGLTKYEREMSAWQRRNILFRWRAEKGLTQTDVGHAIGSALRSVCAWEKGVSRPTPINMAKIGLLIGMKHIDLEKWWDDWEKDKPQFPAEAMGFKQ